MFNLIMGKEKAADQLTRAQMIEELKSISQKMAAVRREFDFVSDEQLIDGVIYEIMSLMQRQCYLLKQLKSLGEKQAPVSAVARQLKA